MRSIKAAAQGHESLGNQITILEKLKVHSKLKNTVVFLWCSLFFMHAVVSSGSLTHVTVYCTEYLGIDEAIGRCLISTLCGGQLVFRILIALVPGSVQKVISTTKYMICHLCVMAVVVTGLTATWWFMPIEHKLQTLYVVFPLMGFMIGGIAPYSVRLVESITPVNGTISCLFMMFWGAGDFSIVFANGELIQKYGAKIQPVSISIYSACVIPILALTICLYRRYQRIQTRIVNYKSVSCGAESPSAIDVTTVTPYHQVDEQSCSKTIPELMDVEGSNRSRVSSTTVSSVASEMDEFLECVECVDVAVIS